MTEVLQRIRILSIEDSPDDAELLLRQFKNAGYEPLFRRVDTLPDLREQLQTSEWDVILCDFRLPGFTAMEALRVVKDFGADTPFILVSGSIGEETAVHAMRAGAHDFFLKDQLPRLTTAIEREVREARVRRERRDAIVQVQDREAQISAIFSQLAVGIVQTDLETRIVLANQRFCDIVGRRPEEVLQSHLEDFAQSEPGASNKSLFERIAKGERSIIRENLLVRPDGTSVWLSSTISVVTDRDGKPTSTVAIVQDISDRRSIERSLQERERELQKAVRARDEFLSIASHELKTPLTSLELQLSSAAQLLRDGRVWRTSSSKLEAKLAAAMRQTNRLTELINNLLDVTRITSGRLTVNRTECDLRAIVESIVARLQDEVRRSGSSLTVQIQTAIVGLWDSMKVEVVITNLLSNAIKYGQGNPIVITAFARPPLAHVVVADRGIGIALEEQQRIFQRFERAVPEQHYGGFGIGLWVARQAVEAHGGTIHVASEQGKGSTFTVQLPMQVGNAP